MGTNLEKVKTFLACQLQHLEDKAKNKDVAMPQSFVTISRETGAGGRSVAKKLAEYLNEKNMAKGCAWEVFDKNLVTHVLEEHQLPQQLGKFMREDKVSEIQDIVDTFFELHPPHFALVKKTSETIAHLATVGHSIIVGRGANVITRKLNGGVHVRLVASLDKRVERAKEYYELEYEEARKKVEREDKARKDYIKQNFDKNIDDPALYDLVLNMDHVPIDVAAKIIGEIVLNRN